jgi:hypothetical protein
MSPQRLVIVPSQQMTSILHWIKGLQQSEKEIEDDWCIIEDTEKEDDIASSICTIEPAIPVLPEPPRAEPNKKEGDKSEPDLKKAVENRILELSNLKTKYHLRNDLAQLKDKELKLRKLQKLQKRS